MSTLYILSAPSGYGKSTYANKLKESEDAVICSADSFFVINGEYRFDRNLLGRAHEKCIDDCLLNMINGKNVVVDNTNTTFKEMKPYIELAQQYNHNVVFCIPKYTISVEELVERNVHNVPKEAIERMCSRYIKVSDLEKFMTERFSNVNFSITLFENK